MAFVPGLTVFSKKLPKLQLGWDAYSLGTFLNCPRRYQYQILEGWVPKMTALDLEFGIRTHAALEHADIARAGGADLMEQLRIATAFALSQPEFDFPTPQKNRFTLVRSVVWYLLNYANKMPKHLSALHIEMPFRFDSGLSYGDESFVLCGHLDGVVELLDGIYVLERKTTKSTLNEQYFGNFTPNHQVTIYYLAGLVVFQVPAKGVLLDAIQTVANFTAFDRRTIARTPGQLEEFTADLVHWLRFAVYYADQNHWPMNEASCRICPFNRVCSKDPSVRESFLQGDFLKRTWNPLIERTAGENR